MKKLIIGLVICLLIFMSVSIHYTNYVRSKHVEEINQAVERIEKFSEKLILNYNLPNLIEEVLPSVVAIEVEGMYGKWYGSGVIVCPDGVIYTAGHVLEEAKKVTIELYDGRTFQVEKWCITPDNDIGWLKIDAEDLPFSYVGNSDDLRIGESVFVIGDPYGLLWSVTTGIISGLDRDISFFGEDLVIQIDAPLNPGNSGGPVYNFKGKVIGIAVGGKGYPGNGIGIIVPINLFDEKERFGTRNCSTCETVQ